VANLGFELGGSQGESPKVGCSKSRSCEIARSEGQPLDPGQGRTVGSEPHRAYHAFGGRRLRGPRLDCRSREVPRAEARV
jgi:hypothetical protein